MGEKKRRLAAQSNSHSTNASVQADVAPAPDNFSSLRQQAAKWLQQGLAAHRNGNAGLAMPAYQAGLLLLKNHHCAERAELMHYIGLLLCAAGKVQDGIASMQLALDCAAQLPDLSARLRAQLHFNLAQAIDEHQIGDDSFLHWQQAFQAAPDDAQYCLAYASALYGRGTTSERCQHQGQAIEILQQYLAQHGNRSSQMLDLLAQWCYQQNRLPQALDYFDQALAINPNLRKQRWPGFAAPQPAACHPGMQRSMLSWQEVLQQHDGVPPFADEAAFSAWLQALDLHIIDHFLPDPLAHREQVLAQPFHALRYAGQNYPGQQTDGQHCPDIMTAIASILQRKIKFISPDNGSSRISFADSLARSDIHVDNESGDSFNLYAAVLYLNLPQQCQGGTSFWRHRASGFCSRADESTMQAAGYASFKSFQQRHLPLNTTSSSRADAQRFNDIVHRRQEWDRLLQVPMRHNRLLIYRGDFFHAIGEVFGSEMQDGRLVQLFFFETLPDESADV